MKYKSGYRYQLHETYQVHIDIGADEPILTDYIELYPNGRLIIRHGYAWDGPSGPAIDTKNFMRGSLIHDALYQLLREGLLEDDLFEPDYRKLADIELHRACIQDGMWRIRAWWVYWCVRLFGGKAASGSQKRRVLVAP